jgi:AsmA family protein
MLRWPELQSRAKAAYRRALGWMSREDSGPAPKRSSRRRVAGRIAVGFAALVGVLVLVLATLDWNTMRGPLSRYLSARFDREVRIDGDLDVTLFSWTPRATLNGLVVQQPDWVTEQNSGAESFAEIERLAVSIELGQLLRGRVVLPELVLTNPAFRLLRDASGRENWRADPDGPDLAPRLPPIRHFAIADGRVHLIDSRKRLVLDGRFASQETDGSSENSFRLDGKGRLNRRPFVLTMTGDPLLNIDPDQPYGFKADVRAGDTRIAAQGSLAEPFNLGAFDVAATFSGPDLAELYDLTGLALPNTPPYRIAGALKRERDVWRFEKFSGTVGDSDIRGTVDVDSSGERPNLKGDVASRQLDFDDLGPAFGLPPSTGSGETASAEQKAEARRQQATARVLSDKPLDVERLRQMDANVHYRADKVVSRDFPLRSADVQVSLEKGILELDPVTVSFAQGAMTGSIKIDARKDTAVTDLDARFSKLKLEQFVSGLGNPPALEGEVLARARLRGGGNSVHKAASSADGSVAIVVPQGRIRQSFAELLGINIARALLLNNQAQTDMRCAVAEFSAKDGILNLNQFVFDTQVVQVSGEGSINMKTETMNLRLTGHPKEFRLVRVRGPITISGPIGRPVVGLDAGNAIAQGGVAAGLAALLSPFAALLPFVDPGLAEDANCAALLNQTQTPIADASRTRR